MVFKASLAGTVLLLTLFGGAAHAQDNGLPALAAVVTEGLGASIGDAAHAGASVFVTASGKARLPAPLSGSYFVNVEGRAVSAVEAARLREQRLDDARRIAHQFGVDMEVGDSAFSHEIDANAQMAQNQRNQAHGGMDTSPPGRNATPATLS